MSIRKTISNIEKKIDNIFSNLFKEEDSNLHKIPIYISKKKNKRNIKDTIKKKKILKFGHNRPCGHNHNRLSIHAEQLAIEYCREHNLKSKIDIYIWGYI